MSNAPMSNAPMSAYREGAFLSTANSMEDVYAGVREHFQKYGDQYLDVRNWLAVIGEEVGEVFAAINKGEWDEAEHEIAQTMACFARLRYEVQRERGGQADAERDRYTLSK